jgi:L-malate glycosyltransferase
LAAKINVLHIIKSLGRGGAETLLPESLQLHDQSRFDFHYLYFLPWKDQLVSALTTHGGIVTCFPANNNMELIFNVSKVVRYIKDHHIHVIHAHLPWAGIVARIASKRTGVPVLYTEHNKQERYHFLTRFMNLKSMNALSGIVAVSEDVAVSIKKHKKNLRIPLHIVLNGVNTDTFVRGVHLSDVRRQLGIAMDAPVVGTIAVFRFQKRLEIWLATAKEILVKRPHTRFIIVGDGPLKNEILSRYDELGLKDKVYFAGLQTEVRPYLEAMDVYMMSSVFEGLPIAMLEAMSFGLPVVTTSAGGIKEVVRHEVEGLVCDVNETEKLADMALRLINNENLRKQYAQAARARVVDSFSMKRMVVDLENLYTNYAQKSPLNGENLKS